jgi:putative FmdB family regulatory protein
MPIYAYRCEACGFTKDVLQKVSDAPLTDCLSCGLSTFRKQLTAAGFQLKGTGWYVTDFRGGAGGTAAAAAPDTSAAPAASAATAPAAATVTAGSTAATTSAAASTTAATSATTSATTSPDK